MTFKKVLRWLPWLLLTFWTAEIVFRRWRWEQTPTQLSAGFVYALVLVNVLLLSRQVRLTRTGRS